MDKGCEFVLDLGVHYSAGQVPDQDIGSAIATNTTPGQTAGQNFLHVLYGVQIAGLYMPFQSQHAYRRGSDM